LVLGLAGAQIPLNWRVTGGSLAAVGLLALGLQHLFGERPRLIEINRETSQALLELGPIRWSVVNGAALGVGFVSRIGFAAWYAIPLTALGFGDPLLGSLVFGAYGAARGLAVWPIFLFMRRGLTHSRIAEGLFAAGPGSRQVGAGCLVALASAAIVIVGT